MCRLCETPGHHIRDCPSKSAARNNTKRKAPAAGGAPPKKPARPLCRFYLKGGCNRKDMCPFSHDGPAPAVEEVCKYHLSNACLKGADCPYSHDLASVPCRLFHLQQHCPRGERGQCRFSHAPLTPAELAALQIRAVMEDTESFTAAVASGRAGPEGDASDEDLPPRKLAPPAPAPAPPPRAVPVPVPGRLALCFEQLAPDQSPFSL